MQNVGSHSQVDVGCTIWMEIADVGGARATEDLGGARTTEDTTGGGDIGQGCEMLLAIDSFWRRLRNVADGR
jgi:hypothetical protein